MSDTTQGLKKLDVDPNSKYKIKYIKDGEYIDSGMDIPTMAWLVFGLTLSELGITNTLLDASNNHTWGCHIRYEEILKVCKIIQTTLDIDQEYTKDWDIEWEDENVTTRDFLYSFTDMIISMSGTLKFTDQIFLDYGVKEPCYCEFCYGYYPKEDM